MQHVVSGLGVANEEDLGATVRVVLVGDLWGGSGWYLSIKRVVREEKHVASVRPSALRQPCTHACTWTRKGLLSFNGSFSSFPYIHHSILVHPPHALPSLPTYPFAYHGPHPVANPTGCFLCSIPVRGAAAAATAAHPSACRGGVEIGLLYELFVWYY